MSKNNQETNPIINLTIASLTLAILCVTTWLWNDYVASYFTIIFPGISLVILLIATIADWIEPSRIPRWYYGLMVISILVPLLIGAIFFYLNEGQLSWMQHL